MASAVWRLVGQLAGRASVDGPPAPVEREVTELFLELRAPLLRYLNGLGVPVADGEDVAQETFLSLFHHLSQGKPRDNLRGWVFRVGRNLGLKRILRNGREPVAAAGDAAEIPCIDGSPNPEEQAEWSRRQAKLLAVVEALPERDRSCLFLRAEGLRYREIAEAMDVSLGSVAASLSQSLNKLRIAGKG